ncbi:9628_t:CDS:1, partial [Cetraspora pellucida]
LVQLLTEIAYQVSLFTIKEVIEFASNIEDSNSIDYFYPYLLTKNWKLQNCIIKLIINKC